MIPVRSSHAQSDREGRVDRMKRLLPQRYQCDPTRGQCKKGDWIDESVADCEYDRRWPWFASTCSAKGGWFLSWTVQQDKNDRCKPVSGKRIRCGDPGTNTRCVCSDYIFERDECRCQYWTEETPGEHMPAFCNAYYLGGMSTVHHWTCCNNCNDATPNTCDGVTYHGGSSTSYCGACGNNTAKNKGEMEYYFNCDSCELQSACQAKCNHTHGGLLKVPGFCWLWSECFYQCCLVAAPQPNKKRSIAVSVAEVANLQFCGDGTCSASETSISCPTDCYYLPNAVKNTTHGITPSCCAAVHVASPFGSSVLIIMLALLASLTTGLL